MTALLNTVDPDGLLEYSVVFTDRSLNHMSAKFQGVMRDISSILKGSVFCRWRCGDSRRRHLWDGSRCAANCCGQKCYGAAQWMVLLSLEPDF